MGPLPPLLIHAILRWVLPCALEANGLSADPIDNLPRTPDVDDLDAALVACRTAVLRGLGRGNERRKPLLDGIAALIAGLRASEEMEAPMAALALEGLGLAMRGRMGAGLGEEEAPEVEIEALGRATTGEG